MIRRGLRSRMPSLRQVSRRLSAVQQTWFMALQQHMNVHSNKHSAWASRFWTRVRWACRAASQRHARRVRRQEREAQAVMDVVEPQSEAVDSSPEREDQPLMALRLHSLMILGFRLMVTKAEWEEWQRTYMHLLEMLGRIRRHATEPWQVINRMKAWLNGTPKMESKGITRKPCAWQMTPGPRLHFCRRWMWKIIQTTPS